MTIAVVTSPMLLLIASSKSCHGTLNSHIASQIHIPVETSNETWLAPSMASLPKMLMSSASSITRTRTGIREIPSRNKVLFFIFAVFVPQVAAR